MEYNEEYANAWENPDNKEFLLFGWEAEADMTGDGSGDPNKYFLPISYPDGEALAFIIHRDSEDYPLDGKDAEFKAATGAWVAKALTYYAENVESYPKVV